MHYDMDSTRTWIASGLLLPLLLHLLYYYDALSPKRVRLVQRRFFRHALYLFLGHFFLLPLLKTALLLCEPVHSLFLERFILSSWHLNAFLWLQYQLSQPKSAFQSISVF